MPDTFATLVNTQGEHGCIDTDAESSLPRKRARITYDTHNLSVKVLQYKADVRALLSIAHEEGQCLFENQSMNHICMSDCLFTAYAEPCPPNQP